MKNSSQVISSGAHLGRKVAGIGISQGRPGGRGCLALTASATENPPGAQLAVIEGEVTIGIATRIIRTWHFYPLFAIVDSYGNLQKHLRQSKFLLCSVL